MSNSLAYFDESGDLGWKLDKPFQGGGSSRYFVIAMAIGVQGNHRRFGKVIDRLRAAQQWTSDKEKKWATVSHAARESFCTFAAEELAKNQNLHVLVAVYFKEHAPDFVRTVDVRALYPNKTEPELQRLEAKFKGRSHLVYAMMVAETLSAHLPTHLRHFSYCPDELNEGQRVLEHILTYRLLLQDQRDLVLNRLDSSAPMEKGLNFADFVAGAVWDAYESGNQQFIDIIKPHIVLKEFKLEDDFAQDGIVSVEAQAAVL